MSSHLNCKHVSRCWNACLCWRKAVQARANYIPLDGEKEFCSQKECDLRSCFCLSMILGHWFTGLKNPDGKAGLESKSLVLTPAGGGCKGGERVVPAACPHQSLRQAPSNSIFKFEIPRENLPQKTYLWKKTKNLKTLVFSPLTCMSLQMLSFYIAENTGWRSKRAHLPQVPN